MGDDDILETAALELLGKVKRAADSAGYQVGAPAVQAALIDLCGRVVTSVAVLQVSGDVRSDLRRHLRGREF